MFSECRKGLFPSLRGTQLARSHPTPCFWEARVIWRIRRWINPTNTSGTNWSSKVLAVQTRTFKIFLRCSTFASVNPWRASALQHGPWSVPSLLHAFYVLIGKPIWTDQAWRWTYTCAGQLCWNIPSSIMGTANSTDVSNEDSPAERLLWTSIHVVLLSDVLFSEWRFIVAAVVLSGCRNWCESLYLCIQQKLLSKATYKWGNNITANIKANNNRRKPTVRLCQRDRVETESRHRGKYRLGDALWRAGSSRVSWR